MFNAMFQFYIVGYVVGLALAAVVWLVSYGCVTLIHAFKHMIDG